MSLDCSATFVGSLISEAHCAFTMAMTVSLVAWSACCADAFIVKAEQQADANNTNINFFISISFGENPVCLSRPCSLFRPQRTTVLLAIVAEPVEKPDARLLSVRA